MFGVGHVVSSAVLYPALQFGVKGGLALTPPGKTGAVATEDAASLPGLSGSAAAIAGNNGTS